MEETTDEATRENPGQIEVDRVDPDSVMLRPGFREDGEVEAHPHEKHLASQLDDVDPAVLSVVLDFFAQPVSYAPHRDQGGTRMDDSKDQDWEIFLPLFKTTF